MINENTNIARVLLFGDCCVAKVGSGFWIFSNYLVLDENENFLIRKIDEIILKSSFFFHFLPHKR
jgi:hypothetical protein